MRKTIRALIFLVAILAVLALFVGGGYLVWKQLSSGPKVDAGTLPTPDAGGVEKQLIGLYLQLRQADLETPADPTGMPVAFTVESGETAADIAAKLQQAGLIKDADLFRMLVRYYDMANRLEAGEYELSPAMTMVEIAERLQHGRLRETTITIPEGWRLEQIAEYLEERGIASRAEFIALA
ncbi:MAG: endolytic transglycosylase MltG, partial [Anaerolineae bacterium]